MIVRKHYLGLFIAVVSVALFSCKKDEPMTPSSNEVILDVKTHVINKNDTSNILAVEKDKILFLQGTLPSDIKVGSIIASDITANAPAGFLRKITSIENVNGQIVVNTVQATLNEAIQEGSATNSRRITASDILEIEFADGTIITQQQIKASVAKLKSAQQRSPQAEWFPIRFDKEFVIYDEDKDESTTDDQIKVKGEMSFTIITHFDYDKDKKGLKYLRTGIGMENQSKITVTAAMKTQSLPDNVKNGYTIAKIKLAPMSFYIGPLPVPYASQSIELVIGLDASAKIHFQTRFDCTNAIDASLEYKRDEGLYPVFTSKNNLIYTPFELKIEGKVEPFFGIYWKADPYLLDSKNSRLEAGPKVSFPIVGSIDTEEAKLKMDFLVSLHMLAKLGFVDVKLIDYDENWKMYEKNIFDKSFKWEKPPIPTDGLVAYYPFNGNANDESGNGNNGTVNGATLTADRKGNANSAYQFGGMSNPNYILVKNSTTLQFSNECTISAFIKPSDWYGMDGWGYGSPNGVHCYFAKSHDAKGITFLYSGSINDISTHLGSFESWAYNKTISASEIGNLLNQWVHFTYVLSKSSVKVYINGRLKETYETTPDFTTTNTQDIYIGKFSDYWYPISGTLDDIRIYNRALSDAEVQALYNE